MLLCLIVYFKIMGNLRISHMASDLWIRPQRIGIVQ